VAAKKIDIKTEKLQAFETGKAKPTLNQLLKIGRVFRKPTAFFYLIDLPEKPKHLQDYRRLPEISAPPGYALLDAVVLAKERRLDAIELISILGREMPAFDLTSAFTVQPSHLAEKIRRVLGISMHQQQSWREAYAALRSWITAAESAGILVFQFSHVNLDDARGFSISEHPLPVVAINGKDWPKAKIFTLIHEIAHITLGAPGICDLHVIDKSDSVEIFCNEVAGELLVPSNYLSTDSIVKQHRSPSWSDQELMQLADKYSVSYEVVLRRLLSLGYTSIDFYQSRRRESIAAAIAKKEKDKGYMLPSTRILRDNGRAFTSLIQQAYTADLIGDLEVSRLLGGINLRHVDSVFGNL
jgi:Zn-dependent peptidase ImmA (M78 family)/DNA-binding XRE family transcriptional regulator